MQSGDARERNGRGHCAPARHGMKDPQQQSEHCRELQEHEGLKDPLAEPHQLMGEFHPDHQEWSILDTASEGGADGVPPLQGAGLIEVVVQIDELPRQARQPDSQGRRDDERPHSGRDPETGVEALTHGEAGLYSAMQVQRWTIRVVTGVVFAATWIFRWLTIDFANDHFVHLSRARQILLGEIPVRDFFDPGLPLHYYASAAALATFGQNLLGEALLTVTLVALGAALTFNLAARGSRSALLGILATIVAVVMFPRLYNYPKVFLYPLALVCVRSYAARRTTLALAGLAGVTVLALLFRFDHGLYIGIAATVGLVMGNLDRLRSVPATLTRFAAIGAALVLPFLVFVQVTAGIGPYLSDAVGKGSSVAGARVLLMPLTIGSGVLTEANAVAWLYYATVLAPVAAGVVLLVQRRRATVTAADTATIGAAIVMCLVIHQTLMRESPDSRLPDVAGPTVVLAAWITGVLLQRHRSAPLTKALAPRLALAALWLATLLSATTLGNTGERITATAIPAGLTAARQRFNDVSELMRLRPIEFYAPPGSTGIRALTRYVLECTRPLDRILAGSFEPQIFFYAERAFAGGQVYLKGGWHESLDDQRLTIARLQRQRVPIVLISVPTEGEVHSRFPLVYQYVRDNYREASRANFGGRDDYAVLVKRDLTPRGTYPPLGLPCYQ